MTRYVLLAETSLDDFSRTSLSIDSYLHIDGGFREGAHVETLWGREDRPGMIRRGSLVWADDSLSPSATVYRAEKGTLTVRCNGVDTHWVPEPQTVEERKRRSIEIGLVQGARGQVLTTEKMLEALSRDLKRSYENRFVMMALRHPRKAALLAKVVAEAEDAHALAVSIEAVLRTRGIDLAEVLAWSHFGLPRSKWPSNGALDGLRDEGLRFIRDSA